MRNPFGTLNRSNREWGSHARKDEDHARGFRRRGRVESIADSLDSDEPVDDGVWYAHEPQPERDWEADFVRRLEVWEINIRNGKSYRNAHKRWMIADDERLAWANNQGWVSFFDADLFSLTETLSLNLPLGGHWVELDVDQLDAWLTKHYGV